MRHVEEFAWLRLLDEEAPVEEFLQHQEALLVGATSEARQSVAAEAQRARRIRRLLLERQQAAAELAVLNDLARRLAALRDAAGVLQEVTSQARRLLAVDVAYIMLRQPDGALRIQYVDGSLGSMMTGIQLAPGVGLGGKVLTGGRPLWSRNYLEDAEFAHSEVIDEAASSEQLGGILGVPLLLAGEAIGVLFAADRRPRGFAPREIELLAAMASHAAVAIHNASLFEANERALQLRERAATLRERLTDLVIAGGDVEAITTELSSALGCDVTMHVSEPPEGAVAVPVRLRTGLAGHLLVDSEDVEVQRLLPIGASAVALVLVSERSLAEAELRTRAELLSGLLSPGVDAQSLRRRARGAGIDLERIESVVIVDSGDGDPSEAGRLARRVEGAIGGWATEYLDHAVVLVPDAGPDAVLDRVRRLHGGDIACAVGVAACGGGPAGVRQSHTEARQTAAVLHALGRHRDSAQVSDLGIYRSLLNQSGRDEIGGFVQRVVGPVLAYDRDRQRDLARTLLVYLQQAQHHARTCDLLHIHANTLYRRLDRIAELLGDDWRDPDRALELQMGLHLHALADRLAARS